MNDQIKYQALTPEVFVFFLLVFAAVGVVFLFIHLLMGSIIRPHVPDPEKLTIYECGEPTVGSAWIQFDLRYYVVALLFVIFDVEVAFFFPWAMVFGKANELATIEDVRPAAVGREEIEKGRKVTAADFTLAEKEKQQSINERRAKLSAQLLPSGLEKKRQMKLGLQTETGAVEPIMPAAARSWAQIAFWDIALFFGVLMVGFAYVWRRGDINWIKSYQHHQEPAIEPEKPLEQQKAAAPPPQPVSAH